MREIAKQKSILKNHPNNGKKKKESCKKPRKSISPEKPKQTPAELNK